MGSLVLLETYNDLLLAKDKVSRINPKACREAVEKYFSVNRMATDYLKLFERIISQGNLVDEKNLPHYNFKKESVRFLYKPTLINQARLLMTGKI